MKYEKWTLTMKARNFSPKFLRLASGCFDPGVSTVTSDLFAKSLHA